MSSLRSSIALTATWAALFLGVALTTASTNARGDELEQGFRQPPDSARPWVYWFWLSGNITREGITADLEAMKQVGIGGVLIMEVDQGAPVGPADFAGPQWRELFKHVVAEAQRLGIEINMNNDAGWNGSGGPWIKPEQSMQRVIFSESKIQGAKRVETTLPQPEATAGYYRDITVLAFPETGDYRIDGIKAKACYEVGDTGPASTKTVPPEMVINRDRIVDLTAKMDKNGRLVWDAPAGNWTIVRFGHTSTGVVNAPAPASGRGLECDKLSKEGIEANYAGLMAKINADSKSACGKTLVTTHIDSWENGAQNWTPRMREEFRSRRGYDLLPYLPVITGRVVGSLEISERFLWDWRQTISDLVVENYAGHLQTLAKRDGLRLSIEAYGGPCDDLPYAGRCDEPMCEFWMGGFMYTNCKEMASAAHVYGKPILGAESFTANDTEKWLDHPGMIKSLGDQAFCAGVNRFVFHRYAMQPWLNRRPGMTMGPWGLHYERTQTWWNDSAAWHQYLARCQFLLRQGLFVADLCYLQPEKSPQNFHGHPLNAYDYDNCSAEVVMTRMSVKDGRLVLPDGLSYRALVLPDWPTMTPALLAKLKDLVEAGATVIGPRPLRAPGLSNYPECDRQVQRLATELWGDEKVATAQDRKLGKGRVISHQAADVVLAKSGIGPDFISRAKLNYIHRTTGQAEIYFVANPEPVNVQAPCTFRVSGKVPELWWPDTGRIQTAPMFKPNKSGTDVGLQLEPGGSVFVVFRNGATAADPVAEITRNGQSVLSLTDTGPQIVIDRAIYGVPGDTQRTRDVRARLQQIVDRGDRSFQISWLAQGDDPADGTVKTLSLNYHVGEHSMSVTGIDPETVSLTPDPHKIVIGKAVYGVLNDPQRTRDRRAKLQRMVDLGLREFTVARMAEDEDPAVLVLKTLILDYTVDGQPRSFTGNDSDLVRLSNPDSKSFVVEMDRTSPRLFANQPGRYTMKTAGGKSVEIDATTLPKPLEIAGPWEVRFDVGEQSPKHVTFDKLASWTTQSDADVKYYSGSAVYTRSFDVPADLIGKGRRLTLDLGQVQVMAAVKINGHDLGLLWRTPYSVDVTDTVKAGDNAIEVRVVNLWVNRMIGDEQLPEDSERNPEGTLKAWPKWLLDGKPSPSGRSSFTTWRLWKKDSPLQQSGLLGPVTLRSVAVLNPE